jgi:hypothetical protein
MTVLLIAEIKNTFTFIVPSPYVQPICYNKTTKKADIRHLSEMLERFLDRIHCYPLAVPIRGLKKSTLDHKTHSEGVDSRVQQRRVAWGCRPVVQGVYRKREEILLLKPKEVSEKEQKEGLAATDGNYRENLIRRYETDLLDLRQQYWLHQQALQRLVNQNPRGPWIREWELMRSRKRHNTTLPWHEGMKACVLKGRCCGRPCGCCEKPLRTYLEPSSSMFGSRKKKIAHIYGHLNSNHCRCCIWSRGFFAGRPRLCRIH